MSICTDWCRRWFPVEEYPNMTEANGFTTSSKYFCIFNENQFIPSKLLSFSLYRNRCCRRNCMPDSKCSENVEGCLTAEDCNTGRTHKFQPYSYDCILLSKKMCKTGQLLKVNPSLQVLSAIALLHVPTVWILMSAQVIFHFNMSTKY